jgi:hypothetical protein
MNKTHIHPLPSSDPSVRAARFEFPGAEPIVVTYESDASFAPEPTSDPFLVAGLLRCMMEGHAVELHGNASSTLLENLEELQAIWHKWKPELYRQVAINVKDSIAPSTPRADNTIAAFSGGVDACFTLAQHLGGHLQHGRKNVTAALLVHGFDIPLDQPETFESARIRTQRMLRDTDLQVKSVRTNFRDLEQPWEDSFGFAVASALLAYQGDYTTGLIGSSEPYDALVLPWGSSPVTDHLYSTAQMTIRHEGAGFSRTEKVGRLLEHPHLVDDLRVCWAGDQLDRNCGACEKCVRTMLNFRVFTDERPACFPADLTADAIRRIRIKNAPQRGELQSILDAAEERNIDEWWTRALAARLGRRRQARDAVVRTAYRAKRVTKRRLQPAGRNR